MKEEDYSKAIEVFSGSPWEAEIIKGLLESNNIRCVIKEGLDRINRYLSRLGF